MRKIIKKVSAVLTSGDKVNEATSIMQYIKNNEETKTQSIFLCFLKMQLHFQKDEINGSCLMESLPISGIISDYMFLICIIQHQTIGVG